MKRLVVAAILACVIGGVLLAWLHRRDITREDAFEAGYKAGARDAGAL